MADGACVRGRSRPFFGFLFVGLVVASGIAGHEVRAQTRPTVVTEAGELQGLRSPYEDSVYVFKGIPYGADTGGENRFRPPQPVEPWSGVKDATELGNRCPGPEFPPPPVMQEEGRDLDKSPMSEDCLVLNVWTPGLDDGGDRPVMVWLHGGGFNSGSGGSIRYDGTNLAHNQDVVLVTLNHRLNIFGFLDLSDINEEFADVANVGMLDIVQALEWVRDNIEQFGGDPDNVTVFGESGGGAKVTTLMGMPAAKGLFHRAIAESGVLGGGRRQTADAREVLDKLGIGEDLDGLAALSTDDVMAAMQGSGPWADGTVLPAYPFKDKAAPVAADVPLMLGWNLTETTFFQGPLGPIDDDELTARTTKLAGGDADEAEKMIAAYGAVYPDAPNNELFLIMASDDWLADSVLNVAGLKGMQEGAPAYVYHFRGRTEVRNLMSPHTLEIAYAFDNLALSTRTNGEVTPEKQALADMMSTAWTHFARTGVPQAPGLPEWKPYTPADEAIMVLQSDPHLLEGSEGILQILGR